MKITTVKGFPVKVGHRNCFIVKIETDEGFSGLGEGGISGRELAMQGMLEHFAPILIGMDPRRIEHIWQLLYRGHYFEGGKIVGGTLSAIDMALWDILGQSLGVPVYQLLGGACRESIRCFATPASLTGPDCVERAREFIDAGWQQLRFGTGMDSRGLDRRRRRDLRARRVDRPGGALDPRGPPGGRADDPPLDRLPPPPLGRRGGPLLPADRRRRARIPRRADPRAEPGSLSPAPRDDADPLRDRRGIRQQVGVLALHRRGADQLRADRCLQRRRG